MTASPPKSSQPMVNFRSSGGFAGLTREACTPLAELDDRLHHLVHALLARGSQPAAGSGDLHRQPGAMRDVPMIELLIEDGERRWSGCFAETELPPELAPLVKSMKARSAPAGATPPRRRR